MCKSELALEYESTCTEFSHEPHTRPLTFPTQQFLLLIIIPQPIVANPTTTSTQLAHQRTDRFQFQQNPHFTYLHLDLTAHIFHPKLYNASWKHFRLRELPASRYAESLKNFAAAAALPDAPHFLRRSSLL